MPTKLKFYNNKSSINSLNFETLHHRRGIDKDAVHLIAVQRPHQQQVQQSSFRPHHSAVHEVSGQQPHSVHDQRGWLRVSAAFEGLL